METPERIDTGDADLACETHGDGPLVICAHGFPDCARTFREQIPALVGAGFRVAAVTMRGYAPSSRARSGRYDGAALGGDLVRVADALSPSEPACLLGHDWGAVAAYAASALAPHRFRRLITAAVPHLRIAGPRWVRLSQLRKSWYMGLFQLNGVAEQRVSRDDMAFVDELWRAWSPGYACSPDEMRHVKNALAENLSEVLDYYRALRRPRRDAARLLTSRTPVPAMYVHGMDDGCVGVEMTRGIARGYASGVEIHHLEGAGHFVHLERPERFNALMLRFLTHG